MRPYEAAVDGVVVRQDVVYADGRRLRRWVRVACPAQPDGFDVGGKGLGDVAGVLFDLVDEVGLVADVVVAEGDEVFEPVGEELAADGGTADGGLDGPAGEEGRDGGVGVAAVDDEETFGRNVGGARCGSGGRWRVVEESGYVVVGVK